MKFGTIVDENKFRVNTACLDENNNILHYELKVNESLVIEGYGIAISMNKPQWQSDTSTWIDTDPLPPVEPEPTPEDEIQIRLAQYEQTLGLLATQVAKNTLLQNGGTTV